MNDDAKNSTPGAPCWTPCKPESVHGEFGWLTLADGPMGPEWQLAHTVDEGVDGPLIPDFVGAGDGNTSECAQADDDRGISIMACRNRASSRANAISSRSVCTSRMARRSRRLSVTRRPPAAALMRTGMMPGEEATGR